MSYTVSLQQRLQQLKKAEADLDGIMREVARNATKRAVDKATEETPVNKTGTNLGSGELRAHWSTDSVIEPEHTGKGYKTELNNNMEYASYVNDGHRMDRHFVPGLYIDGGTLNYDPAYNGGIVVGTKTKYVKGKFMKEKAVEEYKKTVLSELDKRIKGLIE